ncbi:hypothetical protein [Enterococcus sp. DIV0800]|uniref:hypothetical protein n=1 Tax=unclassified Enterococcus TaxID=2608891 RepID=UPI003D2FBE89
MKLIKKIIYIAVFGLFFFISLVGAISVLLHLNIAPNSIFYELEKFNINQFFSNMFSVFSAGLAVLLAIICISWVILTFKNEEFATDFTINIWYYSAKIIICFCLTGTLVISINSEQFSLAATLISFFALISIIFSKNDMNKLKNFLKRIGKKKNNQ